MSNHAYYTKMEAVVSVHGDYCAFHEMSEYCRWVFGDVDCDVEMFETGALEAYGVEHGLFDEKGYLIHDKITKDVKKDLDKLVRKYAENYDGDGHSDYGIFDILVKIENGKVVETYLPI